MFFVELVKAENPPPCDYPIPIIFKSTYKDPKTPFIGCEKFELLEDNTHIRLYNTYLYVAKTSQWYRTYGCWRNTTYSVSPTVHVGLMLGLKYHDTAPNNNGDRYSHDSYNKEAIKLLPSVYYTIKGCYVERLDNLDEKEVANPHMDLPHYQPKGKAYLEMPWMELKTKAKNIKISIGLPLIKVTSIIHYWIRLNDSIWFDGLDKLIHKYVSFT